MEFLKGKKKLMAAMICFFLYDRSICEMKKKTCGQNVVEAPFSHCKATEFCQRGLKCPKSKKKMVCGSDGQFYGNDCEMHSKNCG